MVLLLGWFGFVNFILPSVQDHVPFNCAKLMLPYRYFLEISSSGTKGHKEKS
jgi:hypothetical protein